MKWFKIKILWHLYVFQCPVQVANQSKLGDDWQNKIKKNETDGSNAISGEENLIAVELRWNEVVIILFYWASDQIESVSHENQL